MKKYVSVEVLLPNPPEGYEEKAEYRPAKRGERFISNDGRVIREIRKDVHPSPPRIVLTPKKENYYIEVDIEGINDFTKVEETISSLEKLEGMIAIKVWRKERCKDSTEDSGISKLEPLMSLTKENQ